MDKNKVYLTIEGKKKLQKELTSLKEQKRPQLVKRLANARTLGDLTENSDYINAKEDLSFIDGRIEELGEILAKVQMIKNDQKESKQVKLGCKVVVEGNSERKTFQLVGEWEADPASFKISPSSPLGKALLGKKVKEKVNFEAPAGKITYTILAIE